MSTTDETPLAGSNMDDRRCKNPGCGNLVISFSDYCGEHANSRMVKKQLREYKDKVFDHITLSSVHLKDLKLKDKVFDHAKFDHCEFLFVTFEDCVFDLVDLTHLTFDCCRFENCTFSNFEANDVTWMNSHITGCKFKEGLFSQAVFDDTQVLNCHFEMTEFNGHLFSDLERVDFCNFHLCLFIQTSISKSRFFATVIDNCDLTKSTLHDSYFISCEFKDSSNDFKQTGPPMLCHFNDTSFTNFYLPRSAKRWNNFKLTPKGFYRRIVQLILGEDEENVEDLLSELTQVLNHLQKLEFKPAAAFNQKINELFARLIKANAQDGNYEGAGKVINEYGKIPGQYRLRSSFFLPPPQSNKPVVLAPGARMTLQVDLQDWQLQKVSRLFNKLAALERSIPGPDVQVLNRLEHGSLISVFWGDIKQFLYTGRLLDVEKLELDIDKGEVELKKNQLELKAKEIEMETFREDKELDRAAKRQALEAQRLSMLAQKLDLLERMERRNGIDASAFSQTPEGQAAARIAAEIREEFPIISLRIENDTDGAEEQQ